MSMNVGSSAEYTSHPGIPSLLYEHPDPGVFPRTSSSSFRNALSDLRDLCEEYEQRCGMDVHHPHETISGKTQFHSQSSNKRRLDSSPAKEHLQGVERVILYIDSTAVCVYDKYPKAKRHVLLIPRTHSALGKVGSINDLIPDMHLKHIRDFHNLGHEIANRISLGRKEQEGATMLVGYHALPSLYSLHLHIISTDMDSEWIKSKKHINSFTNPHFFVSSHALEEHMTNAFVDKIKVQVRTERAKEILKVLPLKCYRCGFKLKNVPEWKKHNVTCTEPLDKNHGRMANSLLGWNQSVESDLCHHKGDARVGADIRDYFAAVKKEVDIS